MLKSVLEDVDFNRGAPEQYARLAAGLLVAFTRSFIDGKQATSEIYRFGRRRRKRDSLKCCSTIHFYYITEGD